MYKLKIKVTIQIYRIQLAVCVRQRSRYDLYKSKV